MSFEEIVKEAFKDASEKGAKETGAKTYTMVCLLALNYEEFEEYFGECPACGHKIQMEFYVKPLMRAPP